MVLIPLPVPTDLDAPDAWLLRGMVEVADQVHRETWGSLEGARSGVETLVGLRADPFVEKLRVLALAGPVGAGPADPGRVLGYAAIDLPGQDNAHLAEVYVAVRPERRECGVGGALYEHALGLARDRGRSTLVGYCEQGDDPSDGPGVLPAPTGAGAVRADDPSVVFLTRRGWTLQQVDRRSVLDLPVPADVLARCAGQAEVGAEYDLVRWTGACPQEWVEQYAVLNTRMSTDVPLAGLDMHEDVWDVDRVRALEAEWAAVGTRCHAVVAVHRPTGTLAAYTVLLVRPRPGGLVDQGDTLVLREHRGRRLGMRVKVANLLHLAQADPGSRLVVTWNAQENAHMLAINVALGFRPSGGMSSWQREVAPA